MGIYDAVQDESSLVTMACRGSVEAFEALVQSYEPRIRRMLYSLTGDIQLTQDLCQETFLAAYRALPRMNERELRFAPWLYRIALNQVRSEWRKRKHITVLSLGPFVFNEEADAEQVEGSLVGEERLEERLVERDLIAHTLAQLPPASALCLLMDAEGFSYIEIAETLRDSLPAVRSRLARARQAFRRMYARMEQEGRT